MWDRPPNAKIDSKISRKTLQQTKEISSKEGTKEAKHSKEKKYRVVTSARSAILQAYVQNVWWQP